MMEFHATDNRNSDSRRLMIGGYRLLEYFEAIDDWNTSRSLTIGTMVIGALPSH